MCSRFRHWRISIAVRRTASLRSPMSGNRGGRATWRMKVALCLCLSYDGRIVGRGILLRSFTIIAAVLSMGLAGCAANRLDGFILHPASDGVIRLHNDSGGLITAYIHRFQQARDNGERVVIDGTCLAACTLAVAILPPGRVCVTPQAILGFQSAWKPAPGMTGILSGADRIPNDRATQALMAPHPPVSHQRIDQHGGLTPKLILLKGKELTAIVPKC